ncbi:hypothetical protein Tco_0008828 [Tanacetum coccineum]
MHTYVSRLKNTKLETLIATYDIPLDLRPRLPDPNFRMINLPAGDTAIGMYSRIFDSSGVRIPFSSFLLAVLKYFKVHISQLVPIGLSKVITFERGDPAPVCMEVAKYGLKLWKEKFFLIDHRAIPFHMPCRHPDSCITDKVPTNFNQNHVDQLKAHIVKLSDIPEGVLVRSGLSRVWRNPMCDPVLRLMSIHDFLCMPSLDKATVREEPHGLDTSILGRVADRTTSPAPAVVTKADHAAKRKTSTRPEISTNAAKKTRSSQKVSGAGSSGLAAGDGVEQTDDGTHDDDGQRDGSEFAMEDIGNLNDVSQGEHINVIPLRTFDPGLRPDVTYPPTLLPDKEVKAHAELSGGVRRTTRASFHASHGISEDVSSPAQEAMPAPDTQPLDADAGADEIASDGNVDPYYEARVSNTAGDVFERDLFPFVPGPYYIPYPYDEGSGSESPHYTRDDWEEIHGVNLGLQRKELYKDPKLITNGSMLNARYDHSLRNVEHLSKQCAQQTQTIKKQRADLKQQSESTVHANEEVSRLKAELGALKSKFPLRKPKIEEELVVTNHARASMRVKLRDPGVESKRGLRICRTDEEFRGLSKRYLNNSQSSLQDNARL